MVMVSIHIIMSTASSSCQPHHHLNLSIMSITYSLLNPIIMSTTSSSSIVGKCKSSVSPCEFMGENTLGCETLCFLGWCGSRGHPSRFSVSRLDLREKVHRTVARARFALQNRKKKLTAAWGRQNVAVTRARFHQEKTKKKRHLQSSSERRSRRGCSEKKRGEKRYLNEEVTQWRRSSAKK